jgi:hypothetical protein
MTEEPELPDPGHELHREGPVAPHVLLDQGKELAGDELAHGLPSHALLVREELVEVEEVYVLELGHGHSFHRRGVGRQTTAERGGES